MRNIIAITALLIKKYMRKPTKKTQLGSPTRMYKLVAHCELNVIEEMEIYILF